MPYLRRKNEIADLYCLAFPIFPSFTCAFEPGLIGEVCTFQQAPSFSNASMVADKSFHAARSGSQHIEFLLDLHLVKPQASKQLRMAYSEAAMDVSMQQIETENAALSPTPSSSTDGRNKEETGFEEEQMLLSKSSGKVLADWLEIPEIQVEVDRAIWQVERSIRGKRELSEEKKELDSIHKGPRS